MRKKINLTGRRFGKLTVLKEYEIRRDHKIRWICLCDCGNQCVVISNHLIKGTTRSCGCLRKDRFKKKII